MDLTVKTFNELSNDELYLILQARARVFVVEQNCPYLDIDDIDRRSYHVFYHSNAQIDAYLRVYFKEPGIAQIGRVLTIERGKGLGIDLLKDGIEVCRNRFNAKSVYIEAQSYAIGFYEKAGFKVISGEYLEDGIPHVNMKLDL